MKRTVVFSTEDMPGWGFKRILGGVPGDGASNFFQSHIGNGVDVYLLDSGITSEHSEFSFLNKTSRLNVLADLVDATQNGEDQIGHGTGVASIIAGLFVGVAPEVHLHSVRISRDLHTTPDKVLLGLNTVLQHHLSKAGQGRPSLLNMSLVMKRNAEIDAKVNELTAAGVIVICASGDQGEPVENFSPAGLDNVITVAGFNKNLEWSSGKLKATGEILKNNFGPAVDISAPSELIHVASKKDYALVSGSSIACAYVTGVAACMLESNPNLTAAQLKSQLIQNSRHGLQFSAAHCNGVGADRMLFNPLQLLKPRWDRTQSLLGVFAWNSPVDVRFNCTSRVGDNLTYELINGDLPDGLTFDSSGALRGEIKKPAQATDEPEYYNLLVRAKDSSGESERLLYLVGSSQNRVDDLKLSQGMVRLSSFPKYACDRWCNTTPGGHMCCCVTADTLIETPYGKVAISHLEIGSQVRDAHGAVVKVLDFIEVDLGTRPLYAINSGEAFFTAEHPFVGPAGEFAMDPQLAEQITLRPIQQLAPGAEIYFGEGEKTLRVEKITAVATDLSQSVYNIIVDGSGTYVANGFAISGKLVPGSINLPFKKESVSRVNS